MIRILLTMAFIVLILYSCGTHRSAAVAGQYEYTVRDQQLYDTIARMDSLFFAAYNNCRHELERYASFYSDSLEFYHDSGGLLTSKAEVVAGTEKFVCGKVTRQLVKGSLEVYPIPGYGAVCMGLHRFYNSQEPDAPARPGRFTTIWQKTNAGWKIRRVISLH